MLRQHQVAEFWRQRIARRPLETEKLSPAYRRRHSTRSEEGLRGLNWNYFCFGERRARRRVRREETAKTPPANPASTSVGFSGESSQPLWARAGKATISGIASAIDRMALFIVDPCFCLGPEARDVESFVRRACDALPPCAQGMHHCCLEYVMSE